MGSFTFIPPAFINDFPDDPINYKDLGNYWNINFKAWIQQAMPSSPEPIFFYDPSKLQTPQGKPIAAVTWSALMPQGLCVRLYPERLLNVSTSLDHRLYQSG